MRLHIMFMGTLSFSACRDTAKITAIEITPAEDITTATELLCSVTPPEEDENNPLSIAYQWTKSDLTVLGEAASLALSPEIVQPTDVLTCTTTVTDEKETMNLVDSISVVVGNIAPEVTSVTVTPDSGIQADSTLLCEFEASDADLENFDTRYEWTNSDGTLLGTDALLALSPDVFSPGDDVTCTVIATDAQAGEGSLDVSVTVENTDPVVSDVEITPNTEIATGMTVTCSASAFDLNDGDVTENIGFSWTNQDGTELGTEAELVIDSEATNTGDTLTCTASVTDSNDGIHSSSASILVENTAPEIGSVEVTPLTPNSQESLTCTASDVVDGDDEEVTLSYTWIIDGVPQAETSNMLSAPFSVESNVACHVTPNDGNTDGETVTASVEIVNTDPTAESVSITPNTGVYADSLLSCSGTGSDFDGDEPTISFQWMDSSGTIIGSSAQYQLTSSLFSVGDSIGCMAIATDSNGGSGSISTSVTVENSDPTFVSEAEISGTSMTTGSTLTCAATAEDINDGALTVYYEWNNSAGDVLGSSSTLVIDASNTDVGGGISCTASVTDTHGAGASSTSSSVMVENTAPTVDSVTINPNTGVYSNSTVECSGTASDIDDESLTLSYEWTNFNTNEVLGSDVSLTLSPSDVSPGNQVQCTVTATDPQGEMVSMGATVTVENTAPTWTTEAAITPDSGVVTSSVLTCTAMGDDLDDGALGATYEWSNQNGSALGAGSTLTITEINSNVGDVVSCMATITDSSGESLTSSGSVTVGNTDPLVNTIAIVPDSEVYAGDYLICTASAMDVDGDSTTLSYEWFNNGTDSLGTGNSITLDGPVYQDVVSCVVTATDDNGGSGSSSVEVTLENTAPTVDGAELPEEAYADSTVDCTPVDEYDIDGQELTFSYEWSVNGSVVPNTSGSLSGEFVGGDEVECSITPNDGVDNGEAVSDVITIDNTAPGAPETSISTDTESSSVVLELGFEHGCVLENESITCWGDDSYGQSSPPSGSFKALAVGNYHGCAIDSDDEIQCWGRDVHGEVSNAPSGSFSKITAGRYHGCALDADGYATCWGISGQTPSSGDFGQVDDVPTSVIFSEIDGGMFNSCGIDSDGYLNCWGDDRKDQLSDMPTEQGYAKVSVGNDHVCALKTDQSIACWGINSSNTPNNGGAVSDMPTSGTYLDIQAGYHHSCAVQTDGAAICWGKNDEGQTSSPSSTFSYLSISDEHSCGITGDSQLECWGSLNNDMDNLPTLSGAGQLSELICSVDTESVDIDGDTVNYTYVWTDPDGDIQQTLSSTMELSDSYTDTPFTEGEWTCEVTPNDGTEDGSAASTSVNVLTCFFGDCDSSVDLGGGLGIDFVEISGSDLVDASERYTLSNTFSIMTTEATQGMFESLMGYNPASGYGTGDNYPAYYVTWDMAADFANTLTEYVNTENGSSLSLCYSCSNSGTTSVTCSETMDPYSCDGYSLPTEAEWELAARSGTTYDFWTGDGSNLGGNYSDNSCSTSVTIQDGSTNPQLSDYAWFCGNSNSRSQEVATKTPNGFGLYDVHGNMNEWTSDWYGCTYPNNGTWCNSGSDRVFLGGGWAHYPTTLRASLRNHKVGTSQNNDTGFRLRILSP